jgi:hypothetical protein
MGNIRMQTFAGQSKETTTKTLLYAKCVKKKKHTHTHTHRLSNLSSRSWRPIRLRHRGSNFTYVYNLSTYRGEVNLTRRPPFTSRNIRGTLVKVEPVKPKTL